MGLVAGWDILCRAIIIERTNGSCNFPTSNSKKNPQSHHYALTYANHITAYAVRWWTETVCMDFFATRQRKSTRDITKSTSWWEWPSQRQVSRIVRNRMDRHEKMANAPTEEQVFLGGMDDPLILDVTVVDTEAETYRNLTSIKSGAAADKAQRIHRIEKPVPLYTTGFWKFRFHWPREQRLSEKTLESYWKI